MALKFTIFFGFAWCCFGYEHPAVSYQSFVQHYHPEYNGHHGELSHIGSHLPEHHEEYAWKYPAYEFSYNVDDPHMHDYKGQHEVRDGDGVKGMYWLIQPDGRKRTVTYYADKHTGFNAHVEYSDPHHQQIGHSKYYNHAPKTDVYSLISHPVQQDDHSHYNYFPGHHDMPNYHSPAPVNHDVHSYSYPKPQYDPRYYYYSHY